LESSVKYVTVSIPRAIAEKIDYLIEELGYWPSRGSFVREACLEKIRVEMQRLEDLGGASGGTDRSGRGERREGTRGRESRIVPE
jgi:Arc/MetJ-type ribon-helix-helix transcriptional regulator